jgi:hypothetical protein
MGEKEKMMKNRTVLLPIVVVLIIAAAALAGMASLARPTVVPADAPPDLFSAERAMEHIRAIFSDPHPVGSPEQAQARDYIVSQLKGLGLSPEVQQATTVTPQGSTVNASTVYNVVARIPGSSSSGAILLDAHYDTMPMTPGASDCGSCVATLLETARALQAGPALQNDVLLLFTDHEELGPMAGAAGFVDQHPWASEVELVLNFEGVGRTGPVIMFETGPDSGWLVREWGRSASHPVAQSWYHDVYSITPYSTDMTRFTDKGIGGLNFWYQADATVYHSLLDNPDTIDPRSVQHHGSNALALVQRLGNLDLNEAQRSGDAVYFTLVPGLLVSYSTRWALPLALLVGLLLVGVAVVGFRKGQLSIGGLVRGLLAFLLSAVGAAGLAFGLWMGIVQMQGAYQSMITFGRTYNGSLYLAAFIALSVAISGALHLLFRRKTRATDLAFGALLLLWLLALATGIVFPGLSYLFTWPVLFSLLALGWVLWKESPDTVTWRRELVLVAGAVPGLILFAPVAYVMYHFAPYIAIVIFFVALLLGLLIPQIELLTQIRMRPRKWWLPGAALLFSVGFLVAGSLTADFDAEHPRPNGMAYILDADTGEATWFSPSTQPDEWTTQFYSAKPEYGTLGKVFPIARSSGFPIRHGEAPAMALEAPQVEVLDDQTAGGVRTLRLRLTSPRQAPMMFLDIEPRAAVRAVAIDGQRMETPESKRNLWSLVLYTDPGEGTEITIELEPGQSLALQVSDISRELPDIPGAVFQPRGDDMMPMPNFDYGTVVARTLLID